MRSDARANDRKKGLVLALMDQSYHYAVKIFDCLAREGLVQNDNSQKTLCAFLEIVAFVCCWIERQIQRRVSGQRLKDLEPVFAQMRSAWGVFFIDYPQGPTLEDETAETLGKSIFNKCKTYHSNYDSNLTNHGAFHALQHTCGFLVDMVQNHTARPFRDKTRKGWDDPDGQLVRCVAEVLYSLDRDINVLLFERLSSPGVA